MKKLVSVLLSLTLAAGLLSGCVQSLEDGQRESRSLAGSRLGTAKQIPAFKGGRNGPLLNRRRFGIALRGKCLKNRGNEFQLFKGHVMCLFPFLSCTFYDDPAKTKVIAFH